MPFIRCYAAEISKWKRAAGVLQPQNREKKDDLMESSPCFSVMWAFEPDIFLSLEISLQKAHDHPLSLSWGCSL